MKSKLIVRIAAIILAVLMLGTAFAVAIPMIADSAEVDSEGDSQSSVSYEVGASGSATPRKSTNLTYISQDAPSGREEITLPNGKKGYAFGGADPDNPSDPSKVAVTTGYVNTDYVNLRSGPSTNYSVVTTMRVDTKFTYVSTTPRNGWYNIKLTNGTTGYIYGEYATADPVEVIDDPDVPSGKLSLSTTSATIYTGNKYAITANGVTSASWTSSNASAASVDSNGIVTAKASGTTTIKAVSGSQTASCTVKVVASNGSVSVSSTSISSLPAGKSVLLTSGSAIGWKSSNTSIATVSSKGVVEAKKNGYVTISAYNSSCAATCLIKVTAKENVRFVYASPNSAPKNSTVSFKAITDSTRTAVRFVVSNGSESYTVDATSKEKDGSNYIWTGSGKLSTSGKWTIKAYSKTSTGSYVTTSGSGDGEVFVTNSTDTTTTVTGERRASDGVINLIAYFEGFLSALTDDSITGDPTIGHGRVIYSNDQFYNNLTKNEAYAYLCQTVNSGGYTTRTNAFLVDNGVKFNQNQFDALVCFAYNVGAYAITSDSTLKSLLLDTSAATATVKAGGSGYVNDSYVNLRSGAGTSYSVLDTMAYNTKFTYVDAKLYNSAWYKIKLSNGTVGYIYSTYATPIASGTSTAKDLNNVNKPAFTRALLQYHHAAGSCYWGLLYRRLDEVEMFFYGDYEADGRSNKYNISFVCSVNSSFSL